MAAAYLFYIARGHPFTDGNKRTAGGVAYCFLLQNGFALSEELEVRVAYEALVMGVAEGRLSREAAAEELLGVVPRGPLTLRETQHTETS